MIWHKKNNSQLFQLNIHNDSKQKQNTVPIFLATFCFCWLKTAFKHQYFALSGDVERPSNFLNAMLFRFQFL